MARELPGRSPAELRALLEGAKSALKAFPLPGVVVLPGAPTPFHVFEPRYRALFADALAGDRLLCVPMLVDPQRAMESHPPVHAVAGACEIEAVEALEDGRYDVVVRGIARVRLDLAREHQRGRPYREFPAEVLDDRFPAGGPAALEGEVEGLLQAVYELARRLPTESGAPQLAQAVTRLVGDPGALADIVAAALVSEPATRQQVLEELDVRRRIALVTAETAGVMLMLGGGEKPSA